MRRPDRTPPRVPARPQVTARSPLPAGSTALTAIVLAGGRASRFGGDKLVASVGGRSVLEAVVATTRQLADEVIVVGRPGDAEAAGATRGAAAGVAFLAEDRPFEGPLAGLVVGLRAARARTVVVVGGDMPALDPRVLRLLVERVGGPGAGDSRVGAAALEEAGTIRPLPHAASREPALAAAEAALAAGERSLRALLARIEVTTIAEPEWRALDPRGDSLLDVDTPADLARVRARLEGRG